MNLFGTPQFDFLAIGDIVVDAFIRLKEAEIRQSERKDKLQLCLSFGDKVPYESVTVLPAVGNSSNSAVSAARLGLRTALLTNLGNDQYGKDCLSVLKSEGIDTRFSKIHKEKNTNYHYVLWYKDERTILIKHEEYPYSLPSLGEPKWVYLSSLGEHSLPLHEKIAGWLEAQPGIKLAFQPGTYQMRFGALALKRIYRRAEYFFCNREEAKRILDTKDNDVRHLAERIADLGPKVVFITDGREGAYMFAKGELWHTPIYPDPKPPLERTGAGDAFSSTVTACAVRGIPPGEAMRYALINSMSVVQHVGAQEGLLGLEQIEWYLKKAPEKFKPRKL